MPPMASAPALALQGIGGASYSEAPELSLDIFFPVWKGVG